MDMLKYENVGNMNFFSEISEHQISAREFFSSVLLDSLDRNFGLKRVLISYFDTNGKFLSWVNWNGLLVDCEEHPYRRFMKNDAIRKTIYQDAVRDNLTYYNVTPRLYKSTDIINPAEYNQSAYVRFLEENFCSHYSLTMAFGINAYIQVSFLKPFEKGDFTAEEVGALNRLYIYVANYYKNFKKHEQSKIVSDIQSKIISTGEKAYLVTDYFMNIMSCNKTAENYLRNILGESAIEQINDKSACIWLPFLLGAEDDNNAEDHVRTRIVKNYIFKIYTYDQTYSNKIIDRYHWITISQKEEGKNVNRLVKKLPLTQTERKVAALMYNGLIYKEIADELVVSYHTVKKHVQNIYTKCGVKSRFQLYKYLENIEE